ncbi:TetR/AcrR family transcriptional regulator [Tomitella gaofuii]|uniref:TetR/AcrR family transcriptional regulator n=1 Tax=Tomitella gaofuii TaxID=2760083 RepID=UPI0015FD222C|nr:TetR/AcrR family transcriptional regulator [Tomitella gaofuii]
MGQDSARQRLIEAGEQLYAEAGVGRVRLRELNTLAGVRNDSAVHYHFGSQDGLLEAILQTHLHEIGARVDETTALLCTGRDGSPDALRDAIAALAIPFAEKLRDERGRRFIRIVAQVWGRIGDWQQQRFIPSSALAMDLIRRSARGLPAEVLEERMWLITRFVVSSFAARAENQDAVVDGITLDAFVYDVVGMATAAYFAAPPEGGFWPERWPVIREGERPRRAEQ